MLEPKKYEYDLDNKEDKRIYNEMLDECYGKFMGYDASYILYEVDYPAYECGFYDYVDELPDRYQCPICDEVYDDYDEAKYCCQEEESEEDK